MKFSGVRLASLVALMLWYALSPVRPHGSDVPGNPVLLAAVDAKSTVIAIHNRNTQGALESLNPGDLVAGSIPAPAVPNDCLLGVTQYRIEFPGGPRKLVIDLDGDQDVDLYLRRGSPVAKEGGAILADFKAASPQKKERLSAPSFTQGRDFLLGVPLLEAGAYFIAVTNCGPDAAAYTLSAKILDPPDVDRVNLTVNGVEVGAVPAANTGLCGLGRTQYVAPASHDSCGSSFFWSIAIRADQAINVYVRQSHPVAVENGVLIYDWMTQAPASSQMIGIALSTQGNAAFFIAVENCSSDAANYTVAPSAGIADSFPPVVVEAFFERKDLHVAGYFFGTGAVVLLDGQPQETAVGEMTSDFHEVLIVRRAKKKIPRNQIVHITVKRSECTSTPFQFFRRH